MKLRKEFVLKALAQDVPFRELCREFGISRKTGYKWLERFHERGLEGLVDQSTRPQSSPGRTTSEIAVEIIRLRQAHGTWGPKKIRKLLSKRLPLESELPSLRTISRVLSRVHLLRKKRRRRPADQGWMLQATRKHVVVEVPNDVWTVDFKGWWTTGDGRRCEPLTVRDAFSRYILALRILPRSDTERVRAVFEELFERHGLPKVIQSDNGAPFAAGRSLAGLTKLSAWWISLGIDIVRSRPGCPQDNGAHERMHADISVELQTQAAQSIRAQQRACDDRRVAAGASASYASARHGKRAGSGASNVSAASRARSSGATPGRCAPGYASACAIGVRMSGLPSCASTEPSTYSTIEWITLCGWITTSMRSRGSAEQPVRLDHLEALVHHRRRVDRDLAAHRPSSDARRPRRA